MGKVKLKYNTKDKYINEDETGCFDCGICPYCHEYIDNIDNLVNYDISMSPEINCPNCGEIVHIYFSIQYICSKVDY